MTKNELYEVIENIYDLTQDEELSPRDALAQIEEQCSEAIEIDN